MATYAIYSYEVLENGNSLIDPKTGKKTIDIANQIVGDILKDGLSVTMKKRKDVTVLRSKALHECSSVFAWVLCNIKQLIQYDGHDVNFVDSHPGSYIIIDNRDGVCQIAIEKNSAFNNDTDKVAKSLCRAFNSKLADYHLKMNVKKKWQAAQFKEIVKKRILSGDYVKKIIWEFPNPNKVKCIDTNESTTLSSKLEHMCLITQATNALKGTLTLTGSKDNHLNVNDDKVDDIAQMIALCAQNNYNLTYHFHNSPVVNIKKVSYALCTIENRIINDFMSRKPKEGSHFQEYDLIERLDKIRNEIAGYDNEETVEED